MDLLNKNNALDLNDSSWKIYTEDVTALPQFVGADADIDRAFITQGVSSTELLRTQFSLQVQKLLPVQKSLTAS